MCAIRNTSLVDTNDTKLPQGLTVLLLVFLCCCYALHNQMAAYFVLIRSGKWSYRCSFAADKIANRIASSIAPQYRLLAVTTPCRYILIWSVDISTNNRAPLLPIYWCIRSYYERVGPPRYHWERSPGRTKAFLIGQPLVIFTDLWLRSGIGSNYCIFSICQNRVKVSVFF